jgi:hypothetical protein
MLAGASSALKTRAALQLEIVALRHLSISQIRSVRLNTRSPMLANSSEPCSGLFVGASANCCLDHI